MKKHSQYVFRPATGRTLPQAQIVVKTSPSEVTDDPTPVYSDRNGTVEIPQPFFASSAGKVEFYAPDGRYDIYITYEDISYVDTDVWIYDFTQLIGSAGAAADARYITAVPHASLGEEIVIPSFLGHPDALPEPPSPYDDEFNGALTSWTQLNFNADTTMIQYDSFALIEQRDTSPTAPVGIVRAFTPNTYYAVTAKVALGYHPGTSGSEMAGERPIWGVAIRSHLGEITTMGLRGNAQGISVCAADYNSAGLVNADVLHPVGVNELYVRIRKYLGGIYYEWSTNGRVWVTAKKASSLFSGNPIQIGLIGNLAFVNEGSVTAIADYIRYQQWFVALP